LRNDRFQFFSTIARVRNMSAAVLAIASAFGTITHANAQRVTPPPTPTQITPDPGNSAFLVGHAVGSQGYTCLPTNTGGTAWTVNGRPEATLFTDAFGEQFQIITHFLSINEKPIDQLPPSPAGNATWQSSFDSSRVWAKATGTIPAGSDSNSCKNNGAIPCLLLKSIGNDSGPTGGRLLAKVTFVQRLNTDGGACSYHLLHCGSDSTCTVHSRLLFLPEGRSERRSVRRIFLFTTA
jgi:hypothetical protein